MRLPVLVILSCAAVLIGGLALTTVSAPAGAVVAAAGILGLGGFMIYVNVRAWRTGQGDYLTPGKGYREFHEEQRVAKERQAAKERRSR